MPDVAKKKNTLEPADEGKQPSRSPSWVIYARVDPALEEQVELYIASQEYPPALARVIERALKDLLAKHKLWPPKSSD